ncbi:MAG: Ig domain-containing protein [Candidatus Methanomethylophilaceae archaeon]|nr:Ig domain-containing protein [Candidatus Methanomethylophilaceae archaeon]
MPTTTTENFGARKGPKIAALVVVLIVASIALFTVVGVEDVDAKSTITLSKSVVDMKDNSFDSSVIATFSEVADGYTVEVSSSSNAVSVTASAIENKKSTITVTSGTISSSTGKITATIKVQLNDKTTSPPSKTFTVNVTVGVKSVEIVNESGQSITGKKITLDTAAEKTVKAKFTPTNAYNKNVTWTSSEPSVATITDGKIKALKEGTTKIKVTSADASKTDEITVEVKDIHVTSVTLDPSTASVKMRHQVTLTATILPADATNKNITVSIDNTGLIKKVSQTLSGNKVTIVLEGIPGDKEGTATITVTTEDQKKTANSTIKVERVAVTGVDLKEEAEELEVDEEKTLTYEISPKDATNLKVTWASSNTSVATVDEKGHVKAVSPGTSTITVKTDEGNFTDSCAITVLKTYTIMGTIDGSGNVLNPEALIVKIQEISAKGLYPSFSVLALFQESVSMSSDIVHALQKAKGGEMAIVTLNGSIYFDEDAIDNIDASGKTAGITFTEIPPETYPKFGECYVFEISMTKDGQKNPTSFGSAGPKIAIPHELAEGEDAAKLKVALVYGDGDALLLRNYKFVTDEEEDESAVVFEPPHMSTFMYMFHDSEYISSAGFDIVFVALFLVIVLGLGGGVAFLEFHPVASEKFMNLFDNPNKPPKKPRFPGRSRKNEYDDYYNNDYYR